MMSSDVDPGRGTSGQRKFANRHIASFVALPEYDLDASALNLVQVLNDGKQLTSENLLSSSDLSLSKPILVKDSPESIGMKVLKFSNKRNVSVADIAEILGETYPIHVIDVEHQEELEGWTLGDLVEYFEDEERLFQQAQDQALSAIQSPQSNTGNKRRRKAAEKALSKTGIQRPRVLNQISLEFSKTPLRQTIRSPKFVRDIDWIDHAWPQRHSPEQVTMIYPNVQYYCLTSSAGCFTDFHVDFGGTSVWYHVLSGEKEFCLIPPTPQYLKEYESWLCRPDQASTFFPDLILCEDIIRISLQAGQTLVIPTAWIHAVYTPKDSVVVGGNFLHGLDMKLQLDIHCLETRTRVQEKFRFPLFIPTHFYAGGMYLEKLRRGDVCQEELNGLQHLLEVLDSWWQISDKKSQLQSGPSALSAAQEAAQRNNCPSVEDFLSSLKQEYQRVLQNGISPNPEFPLSAKPKLKLHIKNTPKQSPPKPPPLAETIKSSQTTHEPKIRLKLKTKSSANKSDDNNFRIVVSSSAIKTSTFVGPITKKTKRVREDTEWIDEGATKDDDDWMPGKSKATKAASKQRSTEQRGGRAVSAATKSTSARQRLMKRFR